MTGRNPALATDAPDLAALLAAVARRDEAAFASLYRLTAAKLLGVARRIVRDGNVAEDVVQDAFVKVWRNAGSYSAEVGRPMGWLASITRNAAIDAVRRRREVLAAESDGDTDWFEAVPDPHDAEGAFLDADRLRRCLDRLDETHRRCFVEAYRDGLSREELAGRYDRPVNTIKTWLHRSAAALRTCLEDR